jgi:GlpG protein
MRPPPPLTDFLKYPVTAGLSALAVAVTVAWHAGSDISALFMNFRAWEGELWRLFTSALPHVNVFYLGFNLYWLWVFGSAIEATFGRLRTTAIFLFFAAGSAAAEYAFFRGGVGLSGVVYGLFGLLWVLSRKDDRFRGTVDVQTVGLFVAWFFLCIALTASGVWAIANVAHGMGAVQGVLLGFALAARRGKRLVIACLAGLMLAVVAAATVGRPFVNLSGHAGDDLAYAGYLDLEAGRNERAADLLQRAVRLNDRQGGWWYNLGVAYQRLGREPEAIQAYRMAAEREPSSTVYRTALAEWLSVLAYRKQSAGEAEAAAQLYREALDLDEHNARNWFNLGVACQTLGRHEAATSAFERAVALSPDNERFRAALEASRRRPR